MAPPPPTDWPRPMTEAQLHASFASYQRGLAMLSPSELMAELSRVSALLERQSNQALTSELLRASSSAMDRLDPPSDPMASPSGSSDRSSPPPTTAEPRSWELLARTSRLGPRLAAKLVVASARASARRGR